MMALAAAADPRPAPSSGEISRRRVAIIFNPAAGGGGKAAIVAAVLARLDAAKLDPVLLSTRLPGDAEKFARHAVRENFETIVVAGGDGTLNEVINGLGDAASRIAVLPVGTANVLASDLDLNGDPDRFVEMVRAGLTRPFRVGTANGQRFAVMTSVGFDAQVVASVSPRLKRHLGKVAFMLVALRHLAYYRPPTYAVVIDGQRHEAGLVVVTRSRCYAGRYTIAPQAGADQDEFHICLLAARNRRDLLRYAIALPLGRLPRQHDVQILRGRGIVISGLPGRTEPVQADGDVVSWLPVIITAAQSRLSLVVPCDETSRELSPVNAMMRA
jgi:diacylglycerol kinase (ATP)